MATPTKPTDEELSLVAKHGSGPIVRSIAIVKLAERAGQMDELRRMVEDRDG